MAAISTALLTVLQMAIICWLDVFMAARTVRRQRPAAFGVAHSFIRGDDRFVAARAAPQYQGRVLRDHEPIRCCKST